jgi:tRNA G37 N-methylase Trm5
MTRISLVEFAHRGIRSSLQAGDAVIDATAGNGHDTLFLAQCVGETGRVFAFDLQLAALENTRRRLQQAGRLQRLTAVHASHAELAAHIPLALHGKIKAIMFNLGYLPGADKSIITLVESTLTAVDVASRLLAKGGVLTLLAYPGHAGGDEETRQLAAWCRQLHQDHFQVEEVFSQHPQDKAPRLFVIRKVA